MKKHPVVAALAILLLVLGAAACSRTEEAVTTERSAAEHDRLEFTRMIVHWRQYVEPGYLEFVEQAQPEIVQVGFYGADFWTLGHLPNEVKGLTGPVLPVHAGVVNAVEPAERIRANGDYFEKLNGELHKRGAKVIGHFDVVKYLLGDPADPANPTDGFFKFYRELWDEEELGPKPIDDPLELLQKNADGTPIMTDDADARPYGVYYGCLNNPHWRAVLKAWVKRGIERGLDGFQINYFYRHNCLCQYCRSAFKAYMKERFTPAELSEKFDIADLETHVFPEIVARHDLSKSTPLRQEMHRFSDISNKRAFDDVFIEYGRSLKPDLILSQWLHSSADFRYPPRASVDERMMLPSEMWGKGEDYLWYCLGKAEATLQLRYIRGSFDDKPYTVCHYENVKIRSTFAELAANGGAPMAKYINFTDPLARQELIRYYEFVKRYDEIYRANRPHGEAVLLHPRSQNHQGQFIPAMTAFLEVGQTLLDQHVLFDVIPDEITASEQLEKYKAVLTTSSSRDLDFSNREGFSRFEAPKTVRVSASRPAAGDELTLHFVNYDRKEPEEGARSRGIADENPIAVAGVKADLVIPAGFSVTKVEVITPESPDPVELTAESTEGRVQFTLPEFLVYSVARIHLSPA